MLNTYIKDNNLILSLKQKETLIKYANKLACSEVYSHYKTQEGLMFFAKQRYLCAFIHVQKNGVFHIERTTDGGDLSRPSKY